MHLKSEEIQLNMGPQHPSTHGVLRLMLTLDGEVVVEAVPDIGYLHRGTEKLAELRNYVQFITLTDRLDYITAMMNNMVYVQAVEKLLGLVPTERAEFIRVVCCELNRIASHLLFIGTFGLDVGASTPFLYCFREREKILDLFEMLCGARLTYSYFRIGGLSADLPPGFVETTRQFVKELPRTLDENDELLTFNKIFLARTQQVGVLAPEEAVSYGVSGPPLRASGVPMDVRKDDSYSVYDRFDFKVVTCPEGDCFARYRVRVDEVRESLKIVEQALDMIPDGEIMTKVPKTIRPAAGEAYARVESSRGDLGCYIISDGSSSPYRLKWRGPSFVNLGVIAHMIKGWKVADVVAILGSIDIVLGEVDR
ncbi:MAG: NADH-quinone oxidoreductase subunit D [Armatimonadetes bacterium]|nr:NADH-quinone oxidoreductase subunit D [Armatimonadota bacterium]